MHCKDLLGGTIKNDGSWEMDDHLGYLKITTFKSPMIIRGKRLQVEACQRKWCNHGNQCSGDHRSPAAEPEVAQSVRKTFERLIPNNLSNTRGNNNRQISDTIEDIYGF